MINQRFLIRLILIIFFIFTKFLLSEEKQTSNEIQKNIDSRKSELQSMRNEIKLIEERLLLKNKEAINTTERLLDIETKIILTEKLIKSLNKEEKNLSENIYTTKQIIEDKKILLIKLRKQLTLRLQYIYIYGKPSILETIILSNSWNNAIYRTKYLQILSKYEQKLKNKINQTLDDLKIKKNKLLNEKNQKNKLLNEKLKENTSLETDKKERNVLLKQIKIERKKLEQARTDKNYMITEMESLIKKLYADKTKIKKREEELAKIRQEQNLATIGNFEKMKGKLIWPIKGTIIQHFGRIRNPDTGVLTENVGIDIQAQSGTPVISVLDGMVSTITYIRGHGNIIIIDHGGGFSTVYAKIDNIKVNENDYVQIGSTIASVGMPEDNSSSRLHFEVWGNQKKHNPENWLIQND